MRIIRMIIITNNIFCLLHVYIYIYVDLCVYVQNIVHTYDIGIYYILYIYIGHSRYFWRPHRIEFQICSFTDKNSLGVWTEDLVGLLDRCTWDAQMASSSDLPWLVSIILGSTASHCTRISWDIQPTYYILWGCSNGMKV